MRTLLLLSFMFTHATAQVVAPVVLPAAPNYLLPSLQGNWGTGYGFGQVRPPLYTFGLPNAYPAPIYGLGLPQGFAGQPSFGLNGPQGYPYPRPGFMPPPAFGLGGPLMYPPPQQNSLMPLLAMGLPLLTKLFGGGSGSLDSAPPADCEVCRGLRSSPVARRFGPPPTPPEDLPHVTEATVPVANVAANVPTMPASPTVVPTAARVSTDRIATPDPEPAPTAPTAPARPVVKPTAARVTVARPDTRGITVRQYRATPAQALVVRARTGSDRRSQAAPVWNPFIHNFQICAPGCVPDDYGTYGSRSHHSCHPSGRAIDMHNMICNGRKYRAIDNTPEWRRMVACMESAPSNRNFSQRRTAMAQGLQPMHTLFQNGNPRRVGVTQAHYDHAHFSIACFDGRVW